MPEAAVRAPRTWPERFPPLADERIELACRACGQDWQVHYDLAGYRLRCGCGRWLAVPPDQIMTGAVVGGLQELRFVIDLEAYSDDRCFLRFEFGPPVSP